MRSEWVFDSGSPCLDLVNTLRDRHEGGRELLTGPAALAEWLAAAVRRVPRGSVGERHVNAARTLREAVDRLTRAVAAGGRPTRADVRTLNEVAAAAPPPRLRIATDGTPRLAAPDVPDPVAAALAELAVDAIELAIAAPLVRICAADDCGLRFLDTSPKHNRQWCSMARCGNRAKARAHYARLRGGRRGSAS